jgi:4-amino-4-deoxy-L-arabinose transferase-like glycosyltransferase
VLALGLVAALLLMLAPWFAEHARAGVAALAVVAALAGPLSYSLATAATPHTGAIPSAGPAAATGPGGTGPIRTFAGGAGGGGMGGLLDATTPGDDLVALLREGAGYRWAAATVGSNNAAGYQLASGASVMAIGGFNGTDPAPTLAEFQAYVHSGAVRYFLGDGAMSGTSTGGSDTGQQIAEWVAENYPASTVDGVTVYDLSD